MITIIKNIVNWFTNNFKLVALSIIFLLSAAFFIQRNTIKKQNAEIERVTANMRAYQQLVDDSKANDRVLQLTIDELREVNDSLLNKAKQVQKELKVKDKNLTQLQVINTEGKDSIKTIIKYKHSDFNEVLKLNPLTTIAVSRKDSILTAKLHILNQQVLFIEERKEYKRKYKNGWVRFWHFDFKKIRIRKYQIHNSNPIITITDTRIVELNK